MSDESRRPVSPFVGLIVGLVTVSTASTLIRLAQTAGVDPLAVAAWRLTLATLILAPPTLLTRWRELGSLGRQELLAMLGSGLLLAIHFAAWISSLALTSVAASVLLVSTNPLFVGLVSHLVLKERLTRRMVLGMLIAASGAVIIGLGDASGGQGELRGDLLALVGAISGAGYYMIGRQLRRRLSLLGYVFPVYGTAAVVLMAVAGLARVPMVGYEPRTWLWLLLLAVLPQIMGHSSLNWALAHLSATYVTLATLAEPLGSALLAWVFLREPLTGAAIAGGALVLLGVAVARRGEQGKGTAEDESVLSNPQNGL
jgi:drug/metabolite transporter (DMT)-like permease